MRLNTAHLGFPIHELGLDVRCCERSLQPRRVSTSTRLNELNASVASRASAWCAGGVGRTNKHLRLLPGGGLSDCSHHRQVLHLAILRCLAANTTLVLYKVISNSGLHNRDKEKATDKISKQHFRIYALTTTMSGFFHPFFSRAVPKLILWALTKNANTD
jgi:hypothetical protein